MRFYLASGLDNVPAVLRLRDALHAAGHSITYDWAAHGSMEDRGDEAMREVARRELAGVAAADVVIVLLPGGRGTHIEMGAALAADKQVILSGERIERACAFYCHLNVSRIIFADEEVRVRTVVALLAMRDPKKGPPAGERAA